MRSAAAIKYPWTRLYEELKLVEPSYRKQTFGSDYRAYLEAYEKGANLKYINKDYKPSQGMYTESSLMMRKAYKYNVQTDFIDEYGVTYSSRSSFVVSDVALTRGQIEDLASERLSDIAKDYNITNVKATLTEAWHHEGEAWD